VEQVELWEKLAQQPTAGMQEVHGSLNQHLIRAPLKGVTQIIIVFVFNGRINILILYVFANLRFIQADCTDIIATSPNAVASKIPF
jgi:hypothetical protein